MSDRAACLEEELPQRVYLDSGGTMTVSFHNPAHRMAVIGHDGIAAIEPGLFRVHVGGSQPDARSMELMGIPVSAASFTVDAPNRKIADQEA
jgi:hypothetical protein